MIEKKSKIAEIWKRNGQVINGRVLSCRWYTTDTMIRFFLDSIVFILALVGIWWLFVPLALFSLFWFDRHYESVIAAIMMDILYGAPVLRNVEVFYLFGLLVGALFLFAEIVKKHLRYYGFKKGSI